MFYLLVCLLVWLLFFFYLFNLSVARSTYKKLFLTYDDLLFFYSKVNPVSYRFVYGLRNKTINALTCEELFTIYQGKDCSDLWSTEYNIGKKVGMFSKTRKPFFFR